MQGPHQFEKSHWISDIAAKDREAPQDKDAERNQDGHNQVGPAKSFFTHRPSLWQIVER